LTSIFTLFDLQILLWAREQVKRDSNTMYPPTAAAVALPYLRVTSADSDNKKSLNYH
jgi:hypothetical protein